MKTGSRPSNGSSTGSWKSWEDRSPRARFPIFSKPRSIHLGSEDCHTGHYTRNAGSACNASGKRCARSSSADCPTAAR